MVIIFVVKDPGEKSMYCLLFSNIVLNHNMCPRKLNKDRYSFVFTLQWCHNEHSGISNHQHLDCLLNRFFRCRSKKTSKLRVTGPCEGNSLVTGQFMAQGASNTENVSIWWCRHDHWDCWWPGTIKCSGIIRHSDDKVLVLHTYENVSNWYYKPTRLQITLAIPPGGLIGE